MKVKYKKVDSSVHGEVKEINLIGEDEKDKVIDFMDHLRAQRNKIDRK